MPQCDSVYCNQLIQDHAPWKRKTIILWFFDQMEDNLSWSWCSNDQFGKWKHLLNHIWVNATLNRPQKHPNVVLYGKFSQLYIQYPVRARAYVRSRLSIVYFCFNCIGFVYISANLQRVMTCTNLSKLFSVNWVTCNLCHNLFLIQSILCYIFIYFWKISFLRFSPILNNWVCFWPSKYLIGDCIGVSKFSKDLRAFTDFSKLLQIFRVDSVWSR